MKKEDMNKNWWSGMYISTVHSIDENDSFVPIIEGGNYSQFGTLSLNLYKKWYDQIKNELYLEVENSEIIKFGSTPHRIKHIEAFINEVYAEHKRFIIYDISSFLRISEDKKYICLQYVDKNLSDVIQYIILDYNKYIDYLF